MDVSCVWFCRSRLKGLPGPILMVLVCLTALTVLLQSLYLNVTISQTLRLVLPVSDAPVRSVTRSLQSNTSGADPALPLVNHVFQPFGRAQAVVRFAQNHSGYQYTRHSEGIEHTFFRHPKLFDSYFNGNISLHHENPFSFHKTSNLSYMYIVSAFDRSLYSYSDNINSSTSLTQTSKHANRNIVLTGWLQIDNVNSSLHCCLQDNDGGVIQYLNTKRIIWTQVKKQSLMAVKVMCAVPDGARQPVGVTLVAPGERCADQAAYVAVEAVQKAVAGSIALCSKIAYGTLSAQRLLEWLEIQRYMGVDKILIYVYNLNREAMAVLRWYAQDGLVDIVPYDIPEADSIPRHVGQKQAQPFIDEQVVVFDCMERLRGFTYVGVLDVDEIIFSRISPRHSLKHLMQRLLRRQPMAGGFRFRTEVFITEWVTENITSTEALFWHSRHQNRTRPIMDRTKNVILTERVVLASVWTHNYTATDGFSRYSVPASVATLKHYRPCRENWHCYMRRGYRDTSIASVVREISSLLADRIKLLNISPAAP